MWPEGEIADTAHHRFLAELGTNEAMQDKFKWSDWCAVDPFVSVCLCETSCMTQRHYVDVVSSVGRQWDVQRKGEPGMSTWHQVYCSNQSDRKMLPDDRFCNLCKSFVIDLTFVLTLKRVDGRQLALGRWQASASPWKRKSMCFSPCTGQPTFRSGHLHISM